MSKPAKSKKVAKSKALAPVTAQSLELGPAKVTEGLRTLAAVLAQNLSVAQLSQVYDGIYEAESAVKHLKENAKERILSAVCTGGVQKTEAGSMELQTEEWILEARVRDTGLDDKAVEQLLRSKGMDPGSGMDATITYKTNEVKLATCGLTKEEIESCRKQRTFVLQRPRRMSSSPVSRTGGGGFPE